ncbi:23S rRNA (uracil(1939)-C(5))-methyltransferase RlmD [Terasakiispira papahanaumokuakeensis]|uniref:23S rRNA (uracil(1939)-C(5))-methyltransferase RlmD n=1 Tax=Terasakiispira papahanaumokuakeensis TaxID=197479 RepID=UPI001585DA22|nr:23S rRNA (uracil(1939)-C(5))-methyltransferase RlmD [Terasakiispira papahanaumokuakeensis]
MKSTSSTGSKTAHANEALPPVPGALYIERLSHEGRGVARDEQGKTCFIEGALSGEWVIATTQKTRKRYNEASVTEVVSASQDRVAPVCEHFGRCGGCRLQHLDHHAEVLFKQSRVQEQLHHIGHLSHLPEPDAALCEAPEGYRRKVRLGVKWRRDGRLILGFRAAQSAQLVDIEQCPIMESRLNVLLPSLRRLLETLESRHIGHLELIAGDHSVALSMRWLRDRKRLPARDQQRWIAWGEDHNVAVWLQDDQGFIPLSSSEDQSLQYDVTISSHTVDAAHQDESQVVSLSFGPEDFLQVNAGINQRMIRQALDWLSLSADDTVLDLFCGFGNFTLPLAHVAGRVIGVEGIVVQVERARANAANLTTLKGEVTFMAADLNQPVNWGKLGLEDGVDCVLLDPPRAGAEVQVQQVTQLNPRQILYISCDAATLARDAGLLAAQGYSLVRWGIMDMFPRTAHVETMALFQR